MLETITFILYIILLVILSRITYILYGKDKQFAENGNEKRISEKILLGITAIGGAIGALIGRRVFHHKTKKVYFSLVIHFSILIEIIVMGIIVYFAFVRK